MASIGLPNFGMLGQGVASFGAAAGDLATQNASYEAAHSFTAAGEAEDRASVMARNNENISRASGSIQVAQQRRELYQSMSSTTAAAGGAGLRGGGSMASVLRGSASQGALQQALTGAQTQIQINSEEAQAQSYHAEAEGSYAQSWQSTAQGNAAGAQSGSNMLSGALSMVGGIAAMAML